ncbi:MAG TPA: hypothetical protein VFI39_05765 [Gemmatimonadales bacterium]|nr:hypothetical protein [Gemmatimonadales bacterium]
MPDEPDGSKQFATVMAALQLLHDVDPRRFNRMKRDIRGIWLIGIAGLGEYDTKRRVCKIDPDYIMSLDRSAESIASTIVHEAMHARLAGCGFEYTIERRHRIEQICTQAQIAFASRLPDGSAIVAQARQVLDQPASAWSDEALVDHRLRRLRELKLPEWLMRWFERRAKPPA